MRIYLMQHGPNLSKDKDPEEGLSREGSRLVQAVATAMAGMGLGFARVVTSPKKRARQTAVLVARACGHDEAAIHPSPAAKAMADPNDTLSLIPELPADGACLLVGHLPNLARLASLLLCGDVDGVKLAFHRGGLCRIDAQAPQPGAGELVWQIPPETLAAGL